LWTAYYLTVWDEETLDRVSLTLWPVPAPTGKPKAVRWYSDIHPTTILDPARAKA
jgi:hypothetical protein